MSDAITTSILPPLQASVPMGRVTADGWVYPNDIFLRWANVSLTGRVGGTTSETIPGVSTDLLALTATVGDIQDEVDGLAIVPPVQPSDASPDGSGRLEALESLVNQLAIEINGLKQGTVL